MTAERVSAWVLAHPLSPVEIDCATAVMLKILDGKCKMSALDKFVMTDLYDAVKTRIAGLPGEELHPLIAAARVESSEDLRNLIYEKRVLAETAISRPVMKQFKARLRQEGLFEGISVEEDE